MVGALARSADQPLTNFGVHQHIGHPLAIGDDPGGLQNGHEFVARAVPAAGHRFRQDLIGAGKRGVVEAEFAAAPPGRPSGCARS